MGERLMGHVLMMIRNTLFRKKDPTTPQHFIIWAVYPPYAQHQRPPQPYFTSLHGTVRTRPRGKSRPSDRERIDGAQDRWPAPSGCRAPLPPLQLSAPNWWVVYPWKIGADSRVNVPDSPSSWQMLGFPRAGGSWNCETICVPACARPPGVGGDQDSGVRECKLY